MTCPRCGSTDLMGVSARAGGGRPGYVCRDCDLAFAAKRRPAKPKAKGEAQ